MEEVQGHRLPKSVLPRNYHIELTPRPSARPELGFETFEATVSIAVDVVETVRSFRLNAVELRLHRCSYDGMDGEILVNDPLQQLTIKWPREVRGGTSGVLVIHYDGDVRVGSTGLYQNSYQNGKRRGIGTQMEMAEARRFLPCWDEPAFKATFELAITVPSFYVVLFNSSLVGTPATVQPGLTRHVFSKTPKMSSYLLAIFVGEADSISAKTQRGVEVRVWTPVGHKDLGELVVSCARVVFLFKKLRKCFSQLEDGVKILEFFEEFYGVPYAMDKVDFVGLDTFAYGGMENWGLITYSSSQIYLQPNALNAHKVRASYIVAHELAHMWFGNLVTMAWWNDLWLNEGFATYAGWMAVKHAHPEWDVDAVVFEQELHRALIADSFLGSHAVVMDPTIDDPVKIGNLCDTITYSKGFACLMMAAKFCGERGFTDGVRQYVKKFQYQNTVTKDLWDCLASASGKDVVSFMGRWTESIGYPVVYVSRVGNMLSMRQERFIANGAAAPKSPPWPLDLTMAWGKGQSTLLFDTEATTVELPLMATNNPPYLLLDPLARMMVRVVYSPGMWQDLVKHVLQLSPTDRMSLISSRLALCSAGLVSSGDVLQLVFVLERDTNAAVLKFTLAHVESLFCRVWSRVSLRPDGGESMKTLTNRLMYRLGNAVLERFGPTPVAGESPLCNDLRSIAFRYLVEDPNHSLHAWYLDQFPNWRKLSKSDLVLACYAAGFERTLKVFEEEGNSSDVSTVLLAILGRMVVSEDVKSKKEAFFNSLPSGSIFAFLCAFEDTEHARHIIYRDWSSICTRLSNVSNPLTRLFLHAHQSESSLSVLGDLDAFMAKLTEEQRRLIESTVGQCREAVIGNHKWVERDYGVVRALLSAGGTAPDVASPHPRGKVMAEPDDHDKPPGSLLLTIGESVALIGLVGLVAYGAYRLVKSSSHEQGGHAGQ